MPEQHNIDIDETEYDLDEEAITKNADGTITVSLSKTIRADIKGRDKQVRENTYDEVVFRPMAFGDLKALSHENFENDTAQAYWLLSRLILVPEIVLDKIAGEDMANCMDAVASFLSKSPKT